MEIRVAREAEHAHTIDRTGWPDARWATPDMEVCIDGETGGWNPPPFVWTSVSAANIDSLTATSRSARTRHPKPSSRAKSRDLLAAASLTKKPCVKA